MQQAGVQQRIELIDLQQFVFRCQAQCMVEQVLRMPEGIFCRFVAGKPELQAPQVEQGDPLVVQSHHIIRRSLQQHTEVGHRII